MCVCVHTVLLSIQAEGSEVSVIRYLQNAKEHLCTLHSKTFMGMFKHVPAVLPSLFYPTMQPCYNAS